MLPNRNQLVNIHAHRLSGSPEEWVLTNIRVDNDFPELSTEANYSVGLHPWDIDKDQLLKSIEKVREFAEKKQVIAIGEAGIDKVVSIPIQDQIRAFQLQLEIAAEYSMPVLIHSVKSTQELIAVKKSLPETLPMIIHGFSGGRQLAESLVGAGFYISLGASLKQSQKNREVLSSIPLERIFLETDESNISLHELYEITAEYLEISTLNLMEHMAEKTRNIFF